MRLTVDLETEQGIKAVEELVEVAHGKLTVYVNGRLLEEHAGKLGFLRKCDVQLHGYNHINLGLIGVCRQKREIETAKRVYNAFFNSSPLGWRSPYLGFNTDTLRLLHEAGFLWDSSYHKSSITWLRRIQSPIYLIPIDHKHFIEGSDGTTLLHCYEVTETLLEQVRHLFSSGMPFQRHEEVYTSAVRRRCFKGLFDDYVQTFEVAW